jgi:anti-anti-sigma factor
MADVPADLCTITTENDTVVVGGEIDASNASDLARALADAPPGHLRVDLAAVEFMDVRGVSALLQALLARGLDQFSVVAMSPRVNRIVDLCNLLPLLALRSHPQVTATKPPEPEVSLKAERGIVGT